MFVVSGTFLSHEMPTACCNSNIAPQTPSRSVVYQSPFLVRLSSSLLDSCPSAVSSRTHENQQLLRQQRLQHPRHPGAQPGGINRYTDGGGGVTMPGGGGRGVSTAGTPANDTPWQPQLAMGKAYNTASHLTAQQCIWPQQEQERYQQQHHHPHGVLQGGPREYEGSTRYQDRQSNARRRDVPGAKKTGVVPDEDSAANVPNDGTTTNNGGSPTETVGGSGPDNRRSGVEGGNTVGGGDNKRRMAADDRCDVIRQSCGHCTKKKTKCSGGPGQCLRWVLVGVWVGSLLGVYSRSS